MCKLFDGLHAQENAASLFTTSLIRANKKHGTNEPVITVKQGKKNTYCHSVEVMGPSVVRYGGNDHPILPCGARVVIETESEVRIGE